MVKAISTISAASTFWGLAHLAWDDARGVFGLPLKGVYFSSLSLCAIYAFCT